jgi:hypothetical protein
MCGNKEKSYRETLGDVFKTATYTTDKAIIRSYETKKSVAVKDAL